MQTADRLKKIPPYLFMELRKKINKARAEGVDVISLGVGDPVEATPKSIIDELCRAAYDPQNHRYPTDEEKGMLTFRKEVARWYAERYGVSLNPENEILGLIGSKEGCHHFTSGARQSRRYRAHDRPRLSGLPLQHSDGGEAFLIMCRFCRRTTTCRRWKIFPRMSPGKQRRCF